MNDVVSSRMNKQTNSKDAKCEWGSGVVKGSAQRNLIEHYIHQIIDLERSLEPDVRLYRLGDSYMGTGNSETVSETRSKDNSNSYITNRTEQHSQTESERPNNQLRMLI